MDAQEYIAEYCANKSRGYIFYEAIGRKDATLLSAPFRGILLSDVFVFDPKYLTYVSNTHNASDELKQIAKSIIRSRARGLEDVATEIATS